MLQTCRDRAVGADDSAAFCRDNGFPSRTKLLQRSAHKLLGTAITVDGGRIDPIDAQIDGANDRVNRFLFVLRAPAERPVTTTNGPSAQVDRRLLQGATTEFASLHGDPLSFLKTAVYRLKW